MKVATRKKTDGKIWYINLLTGEIYLADGKKEALKYFELDGKMENRVKTLEEYNSMMKKMADGSK